MNDDRFDGTSIYGRMATRMRILPLEARLRRAVVEGDADLAGLPQEQVRHAIDTHAAVRQDIQALRDEESTARPYPDGDVCHIFLDEPVFGEQNPPEPDALLYHFTRAWTLTKIKSKRSLRFALAPGGWAVSRAACLPLADVIGTARHG